MMSCSIRGDCIESWEVAGVLYNTSVLQNFVCCTGHKSAVTSLAVSQGCFALWLAGLPSLWMLLEVCDRRSEIWLHHGTLLW